MPSEAMRCTWSDVDWQRNRLTVRKGKTKQREIPIFPQLRPFLEDCFDPEATHVIVRHRAHTNWGTDVKRFIAKAGVEVWPRVFHNLRASVETDLAHRFPIHIVTTWLGNSPKVAADHYLSIRDEDFAFAIAGGVGQGVGQHPAETTENGSQRVAATRGFFPEKSALAGEYGESKHAQKDSNLRPTD